MLRYFMIFTFSLFVLTAQTAFAETITKNISIQNQTKYPIQKVTITIEERKPDGKVTHPAIKLGAIAPHGKESASISFPVNVDYKVHIDVSAKFTINDSSEYSLYSIQRGEEMGPPSDEELTVVCITDTKDGRDRPWCKKAKTNSK